MYNLQVPELSSISNLKLQKGQLWLGAFNSGQWILWEILGTAGVESPNLYGKYSKMRSVMAHPIHNTYASLMGRDYRMLSKPYPNTLSPDHIKSKARLLHDPQRVWEIILSMKECLVKEDTRMQDVVGEINGGFTPDWTAQHILEDQYQREFNDLQVQLTSLRVMR